MVASTNKRLYYWLYLLFVLLSFYAVQDFNTSKNIGLVGADRSLVHVSVATIIAVLSIYLCLSVFRRKLALLSVVLSLAAIFIWCVLVDIFQREYSWLLMVRLGLAALWILVFYFFFSYFKRFPGALFQLGIGVCFFFIFYSFAAIYAAHSISIARDKIAVVNMAYNVLVFLPWIFLLRKKWLRITGIGVVFLVVLFSMKRGVIVAFPLMVSSALLVEGAINRKRFMYFVKVLFAAALFLFGVFMADLYSEGFLSERFSPEQLAEGSGRYEKYTSALDAISRRDPQEFLIGTGTGSSNEFYSGSAVHNEWLEFLFSYGAIGVVLYCALVLVLLGRLRGHIRARSSMSMAYCSAVVYLFVVGIYGSIYFAHTTFFIMALLGTIEGLVQNTSNVLIAAPRSNKHP